jgi:hypothetical protein
LRFGSTLQAALKLQKKSLFIQCQCKLPHISMPIDHLRSRLADDYVVGVGSKRCRRSWKEGSATSSYDDGGCRECRYDLPDVH